MELGFLISFAGNLTYPKAQPLRDVAARVPLDRLLVETDAPFLAPCPIAGSATSRPGWRIRPAVLAGPQGRFGEEIGLRDDEKLRAAVWTDPRTCET
jgi:TatD DNase family protein